MNTTLSFRRFRAVAAGRQILGNRDRQEDSFRIHTQKGNSGEPRLLSILSDGMGGMGNGDIASSTIVHAFWESYSADDSGDLLKSLRSANLSLLRKKQAGETSEKSGGTVIAVQIEEAGFSWLSIGDSLLFIQRGKEVRKLNAAHTWGWELERRVREGEISQAEADACDIPREALYAAVCGNDIPAVDICQPSSCHIGDRLVIASDGLLPLLNNQPDTILNLPEIRNASPDEACEILLRRLQQTSHPQLDNSTVLIMDIVALPGAEGSDTPPGTWRSARISELGNRSSQQDATLVEFSDQAALAVVADGAGGHTDGAIASATAVRSLKETWERSLSGGLKEDAAAMVLREALVQAHHAILKTADGNVKRCGKCALVLLYLCGREYTIVSAGDCRCYQSGSKGWELKTHDDSLLQLQLDRGMIKPEDAGGHPDQGILTQALGGEQAPSPHVIQGKCEPGSTFLLCCDGFWNQLPTCWATETWHTERGITAHKNVLGDKVKQAIAGAHGKSDNVSAIWLYGAQHCAAEPRRTRGKTLLLLICLLCALGACALLFSRHLTAEAEGQHEAQQQGHQHMQNVRQQQNPFEKENLGQADTPDETDEQRQHASPEPKHSPPPSTDAPPDSEENQRKGTRTKEEQQEDSQPSEYQPKQGETHQDNKQSSPGKNPDPQEDNGMQQHFEQDFPLPLEVQEITFSPDGQYLACCDSSGTLYLATVANHKCVPLLPPESSVTGISFSPNSKELAIGQENGQILIIAPETLKIVHTIIANGAITAVQFSPSGMRLAVGTSDKNATVYHIADNTASVMIPYNGLPEAFAFPPNGQYFIVCGDQGEATFVNFKGLPNRREQFHSQRIIGIAFSSDGNYIATGSDDHTAIVREASTHKIIRKVTHREAVLTVSFSPDGNYLATGSADNTVKVTEISTGNILHHIVLPAAATSVTFTPDGSYLVAISADGARHLYHFTTTPQQNNEQY